MIKPKHKTKKNGVKKHPKEEVEEAANGDDKSLSFSEFDDVFDVNYTILS